MLKTSPKVPSEQTGRPRRTGRALAATGLVVAAMTHQVPLVWAEDIPESGGLVTETLASPQSSVLAAPSASEPTPKGLRYGSFFVAPSLLAKTVYDDNIFSLPKDKVSDVRVEVVPVVVVTSRLPRHVLNFSITGKLVEYLENSEQSHQDVRAGLSAGLHIDHAHTLSFGIISELKHEEVGQILTPEDAASPIPVFHNKAVAGLTRDTGRLYGTVSFGAESFDFYDVDKLGGGTLDQDYRDTQILSGQVRAGYRINPSMDLVANAKVIRQLNEGNEIYNTQSTGLEGSLGLKFQSSALLEWHFFAGYATRDFDYDDTGSIGAATFEGGLTWRPTERATIKSTISRSIDTTSSADSDGVVKTSASASLDYEIYHNLIGHAGVTVSDYDFSLEDRSDTLVGASVGLDYLITPDWKLTLGYTHERRSSTDDDYDITRNKIMIGAKLSF